MLEKHIYLMEPMQSSDEMARSVHKSAEVSPALRMEMFEAVKRYNTDPDSVKYDNHQRRFKLVAIIAKVPSIDVESANHLLYKYSDDINKIVSSPVPELAKNGELGRAKASLIHSALALCREDAAKGPEIQSAKTDAQLRHGELHDAIGEIVIRRYEKGREVSTTTYPMPPVQ